MFRPDLIAREITNGIQFWLFVSVSVCLTVYIIYYKLMTRHEWNIFTFIPGLFVGLFASLAIMRGWIWKLLWDFNHGHAPTAPDDYWLSIMSTGGAVVCGSFLVFMLTPRWPGQSHIGRHWPWVFTTSVSVGVPIGAYFIH